MSAAPETICMQAATLARQGRGQAALALLARTVPSVESLWLQGDILMGLRRYADAAVCYARLGADDAAAQAAHGDALRLAGAIPEARICYRRALHICPDHPRGLNGFGHLAAIAGQWEAARDWHQRAITAAPAEAEAHNGLGIALSWLGDHAGALASFSRALALAPAYADAMINTGNTLRRLGRADDALAAFDRAVAIDPGSAETHYSRAAALIDLGRLEPALAACDDALARAPTFVPALMRRGEILARVGRLLDALAVYDSALAVPGAAPPLAAELHLLSSHAWSALKDTEAALAACDQAIAIRRDMAEAWSQRGLLLRDLNEYDEAVTSLDEALRLDPANLQARNNRALALASLGRLEEALAETRAVIARDPANAPAYNNLGNWLRQSGRLAEAAAALETAVRLSPEPEEARLNYAMCLLQAGDFAAGWRAYEARWNTPARPAPIADLGRPLWRGQEPVAGRRLYLYAEQGYGDAIQFCRYAPLAADLGAVVTLGVPAPLCRLMESLHPHVTVIDRTETPPPFDLHAPLMTLPLAFGTELATIPARVPYLAAPAERLPAWRARLGPARGARIGLAWTGSTGHREDAARSIPLAQMAPLLAGAVEWVCLQRDIRHADLPVIAQTRNLRIVSHALGDFADTAALIAQLDLVIAVDTAVLHLAGALGIETWALIPSAPDWRWLAGRADSPWYPTMRLYRQTTAGDWPGVLDRVAHDLAERVP